MPGPDFASTSPAPVQAGMPGFEAATALGVQTGSAPSLLLIGALYLTQGLPIGFLFEALPVLLRQNGVGLDAIALLPLTALPWIFKFLWAPVVDNYSLKAVGRRRSWLLPMQAILVVTLAVCALLPPEPENVLALLAVFFIGSMAAATQDTATDGLAAETLTGERLATANALQTAGMMAGFMLGGAGTLIVVDTAGYATAIGMLALLALASFVPVALWRESGTQTAAGHESHSPLPASLRHTLKRDGIGLLLLLGLGYGVAQSAGNSLSRLMLTDAGWSLSDIGLLAAAGGLGMIFVGAPAGSRLTARLGVWKTILIGLSLALAGCGIWLALAGQASLPAGAMLPVIATVSLGSGGGIISVAASTLAMRFAARGTQTATDVTVLQSAHVTGDMASGSLAVALAASAGYAGAFGGVMAAALLTALLVIRMMRHGGLRTL